jgi:isoleucyl-tRNA synthetase
LVSSGLQVRTANKLRVRQPLEAAEIVLADPDIAAALRDHVDLIRDELNVRDVHFVESADEYVTYQVKPNFRALGPRVGKQMPALKKVLADADGAALLAEFDSNGVVAVDLGGEAFELSPDEIAVTLKARDGFAAASGSAGVVVLSTTLTPDLIEEGLFREILNRVQTFRKELDLEYTARIRLTLTGGEPLLAAVRERIDALASEVLATDVALAAEPTGGAEVREVAIEGETLTIGLTVEDLSP